MGKTKTSPTSNPAKTPAIKQAGILRKLRCDLFENLLAVEIAKRSSITFSCSKERITGKAAEPQWTAIQNVSDGKCAPGVFKSKALKASAVKAFLKLVLSGKPERGGLLIRIGKFELLFLEIAAGEVVLDIEQLGEVFNQAALVMIEVVRAVEAARFKGARELDRGKRRGERIRAGEDSVTEKVKRLFQELGLDEEMSERRNALKIQRAWGDKPAPSESTIRRRLRQLWLSRNNFGSGVTKD